MGKSKYFKSRDEYVSVMKALIETLKYDKKVGGDIAKSKIIIKFVYRDPEVSVTINAKDRPDEQNAYFIYTWDDKTTVPEVTMTSTADYSLRFWQGKENAVLSITLGKLKATGNIPKALSLLPIIKPAFSMFPKILRNMGRGDLVV